MNRNANRMHMAGIERGTRNDSLVIKHDQAAAAIAIETQQKPYNEAILVVY